MRYKVCNKKIPYRMVKNICPFRKKYLRKAENLSRRYCEIGSGKCSGFAGLSPFTYA